MSADRGHHDQQRHADALRARHEISYEEALKYAARRGVGYVRAVEELVRRKERRGR